MTEHVGWSNFLLWKASRLAPVFDVSNNFGF